MTPFIVTHAFHKSVILCALKDLKSMLDANIHQLEGEKEFMPGMPEVIEGYKAMLNTTDQMLSALYDNNTDKELDIAHHFALAPTYPKFGELKAKFLNICTYQEPNKLPQDLPGGIYSYYETAQDFPGDNDNEHYKSFRTVIFFELEKKVSE